MLSQAQARIGFSVDQCRERYGEEVKTEAAWSSPSQTAYGFVAGKLWGGRSALWHNLIWNKQPSKTRSGAKRERKKQNPFMRQPPY